MAPTRVYVPVGRRVEDQAGAERSRASVRNRTVAIINNGWGSMDRLAEHIDSELRAAYGVADVVHFRNPDISHPADDGLLKEVAATATAAITGLGN